MYKHVPSNSIFRKWSLKNTLTLFFIWICRAMLSNPPIPHLGRDFNDEATEVENYEVW